MFILLNCLVKTFGARLNRDGKVGDLAPPDLRGNFQVFFLGCECDLSCESFAHGLYQAEGSPLHSCFALEQMPTRGVPLHSVLLTWTAVVNSTLSHPCIPERTLPNQTFHPWQILDGTMGKGGRLGGLEVAGASVDSVCYFGAIVRQRGGCRTSCSPPVGQEAEGDRKERGSG